MSSASSTDVVVVGAGCAGLCAAVEAAERGLRVVVLEKLVSPFKSSTAASGGYFAFVNTDLQRRDRVLDSDAEFRRDMEKGGGGESDPALVDLYLAHQLDTYYWLQEHGSVFWQAEMGIGMNVPRCHATDPQRLIETLLRSARRLGVRFEFDCPAQSLEALGRSFRVRGARGLELVAQRAVILASGGFSRNPTLLGRFVPGLERVRIVDGGLGSTGDGIVLAESLGAAITSMATVKPNFFSYAFREQHEGILDRFRHETPVGMVYQLGGILVTQAGHRYVREDMNAKDIALVTLKLPDAMAWGIYDHAIFRRALEEKTIYINPAAMRSSLKADTLAELAKRANIPEQALIETVESYNANCTAGSADPLGRRYETAERGKPVPLTNPPFYAFPTAPNMATTFGGLRIDTNARVLDRAGAPIEGLYACGEIVGGFHGSNFVTGTALAQAAIFGRVAAMSAEAGPPERQHVVRNDANRG